MKINTNIVKYILPYLLVLLIACKEDSKGQQIIANKQIAINYTDSIKNIPFQTQVVQKKIAYYKDKNHVYDTRMNVLNDIDCASFKIISDNIVADNKYVYHKEYPSNLIKNEDIDAATIEFLGEKEGYEILKDKNKVYIFSDETFEIIKDADASTFEKIYDNVYADKSNLYNFKGWALCEFEASAEKAVFDDYDTEAVEGGNLYRININKKKMRHLKYGVFTDNNEVFSLKWLSVFENADPKTFTVINTIFSKDKNTVYEYGSKLNNIDAKTFSVLYVSENTSLYKDKNGIYIDGIKFRNIDVSSFEMLSPSYYRDKNHVYFRSFVIPDADVNSFQLLKDGNGKPAIAVDKNHVYWASKIVKEVHPKDIINIIGKNEWLDNDFWYAIIYDNGDYKLLKCDRIKAANLPASYYYTFKGNIYYDGAGYCKGNELLNVDSESFVAINEEYSKDKNFVYFKGKPILYFSYKSRKTGKFITSSKGAYDLAQKLDGRAITEESAIDFLKLLLGKKPLYTDKNDIIKTAKETIADMIGAKTIGDKLDPSSVQFFGKNLGKDKNYYFRNGRIYTHRSSASTKFDFNSFQSVGHTWSFYKDKNHVYDDNLKILKGVDAKTIIPVYTK